MKIVKAVVPAGRSSFLQDVELYSKEEAKSILLDREWEIGEDIYSPSKRNKRIGWLASFGDGTGIYIEVTD